MTINDQSVVGVVGAGTMGLGIAQLAAVAGHGVVLAGVMDDAVARARGTISKNLERDVQKGRASAADAVASLARIDFHAIPLGAELTPFGSCDLVIEAVAEDLGVKQNLFRQLEQIVTREAVLATNTSSLSIASIASACEASARVIGLHFFNPAPVMPLVEVIPWIGGRAGLDREARELMTHWRKTTVLASDTPGFIVNRVARPFYGEAIRILEEGIADTATIDWAMTECGKFRMGPFELMDFIGNDVNYAVTRSVFEAFFYDPRYKPSLTQRRMVDAGFLGRKSGRGYYDYRDGAAKPAPARDAELGARIVERVLAMLINEAVDAVFLRVASEADVDLAMTKGVNYPRGPLAWANELGLGHVLGVIEGLQAEYGEDRYRPSPLLRRMARDGRRFFA